MMNLYGQTDMFMFGNTRPVADAGKDVKTSSKGSIFLDGSRSYVGDGSKIKYRWDFAPGLALKSDNDFTSAISVQTYGSKFLKSVETYQSVIDLKLNENEPGTKLEVILTIKDRIGFEDSDTLIVEYYNPVVQNKTKFDTVERSLTKQRQTFSFENNILIEETSTPIIFIQGFDDGKLNKVDANIINSIIIDQIKSVGFDYEILLGNNIEKNNRPNGYSSNCNSDDCILRNASLLKAKYALSWNFAEAVDELYLRISEVKKINTLINDFTIVGPYGIMNDAGIYGLDKKLRLGISRMLSAKDFKNNISGIDRLIMRNEKLFSYGRYPFMVGAIYLLLDKLLDKPSEEPEIELPPGFPHD
tara:strand:- start:249 stop:1325 length:1077 start_codon:yes stop_codon:yes gene_type:complete